MPFVYKYDIIYNMKSKKFITIFAIALAILIFCPPISVKAEQFIAEGQLKNTLVFLTFESEGDNFENNFQSDVLKIYSETTHSVRNYLLKQSGNRIDLQTQILHANDGEVVRSNHGVNYYKPRYRWINGTYFEINSEGYDNRYYTKDGKAVAENTKGALQSAESAYREQLLIREIVEKLNLSSEYDSDLNKDGEVDSLIIITDCNTKDSSEWGGILWAHKGTCHEFTDQSLKSFYYDIENESYQALTVPTLGNAVLSSYNLLSSYSITSKKVGDYNEFVGEEEKNLYNVGLLTHEMLHVIGLSDYYSYTDSVYQSVGEFDVMGITDVLPQNMLAYLRLKLGWISYDEVLYINESGQYTLPLSTVSAGKKVAKIVLNDYHETGEYFMAEFRGRSFSTQTDAFDGSLSGDGLIIYRVNPQASFVNAIGETGSYDYGNMFGDDEVYVYRLGDPKRLKKLTSPDLNQSYAMLGAGKTVITPANKGELYYDNAYGNTDKNKNLSNIFTSILQPSETVIDYSNGKNSGIRFSDISIDYDAQTVSFKVELPEKQGDKLQLSSQSVSLKKQNGRQYVTWQTPVKDGEVKVLVLKSTNRLKTQAQKGSLKLSAKHFEKQKYGFYKTLYTAQVPLAEKQFKIPSFESESLVFTLSQTKSGESVVSYAGCLVNNSPTFAQFLYMAFDPVYIILTVAICVFVFVGAFFAIIYVKKNNEKRIIRK